MQLKSFKLFIIISLSIFIFSCATYKNKPLVEKFSYPKTHCKLTPEKAVCLALQFNPYLKTERAKYSIEKSLLLSAGLLENPELGQDIVFPVKNKSSDTVTGFDLSISWSTNNLFTPHLLKKAAEIKKRQIILELAWKEWLTSEKAKLTTYDLLFLQNEIKEAKNLLNKIQSQINKIKSYVNSGLLDSSYLYNFQSSYFSIKKFLNKLNLEYTKKEYELKNLIGYPPEKRIELANISLNFQKIKTPAYKVLIKSLNKNRPDIIAIKNAYRENELLLHASIIEQFPALNLNLSYSKDTDKLYSFVPGVSFSLPIFNHNQAKIAKFRAKRKKLFYEFNSRIYKAKINISKILFLKGREEKLIQDIKKNINFLNSQLLKEKESLKIGNANIIEIFKIQNQLEKAKITLISAQMEYVNLIILLEMETGKEIIKVQRSRFKVN